MELHPLTETERSSSCSLTDPKAPHRLIPVYGRALASGADWAPPGVAWEIEIILDGIERDTRVAEFLC